MKSICFNTSNPNLYLVGNKESELNRKDTTYIILEVNRCQNSSYCEKNPTKVDEWLQNKVLRPSYMNNIPNFKNIDHDQKVFSSTQVFPSIKLLNKTTDTGYRFRYNSFEHID